MNKTKIEWCDYTVNPVKGLCPMACSYCYARAMYKRFKWDETIRQIEAGFIINDLKKMKPNSKVLWGSTMELFHEQLPDLWRKDIFKIVNQFPHLTHIFLTKQPQNLQRWSPFPDNCWIGVSATNTQESVHRVGNILYAIQAKVKFSSLEPLLDWDTSSFQVSIEDSFMRALDWLIIGQQTPVRNATIPKLKWIQEIVEAADKANVPVFLKNNLDCLLCQSEFVRWKGKDTEGHDLIGLRQEFPRV